MALNIIKNSTTMDESDDSFATPIGKDVTSTTSAAASTTRTDRLVAGIGAFEIPSLPHHFHSTTGLVHGVAQRLDHHSINNHNNNHKSNNCILFSLQVEHSDANGNPKVEHKPLFVAQRVAKTSFWLYDISDLNNNTNNHHNHNHDTVIEQIRSNVSQDHPRYVGSLDRIRGASGASQYIHYALFDDKRSSRSRGGSDSTNDLRQQQQRQRQQVASIWYNLPPYFKVFGITDKRPREATIAIYNHGNYHTTSPLSCSTSSPSSSAESSTSSDGTCGIDPSAMTTAANVMKVSVHDVLHDWNDTRTTNTEDDSASCPSLLVASSSSSLISMSSSSNNNNNNTHHDVTTTFDEAGLHVFESKQLPEPPTTTPPNNSKSNTKSKSKQPTLSTIFKGRSGGMPSTKNLQMIDESSEQVVLQMAKWDQDAFHVDFQDPFNAYQVFGFALAQLDL